MSKKLNNDPPSLDEFGMNSVGLDDLASQLNQNGIDEFSNMYRCAFLILQYSPPKKEDWMDLDTSESSLPRLADIKNAPSLIKVIPLSKSNRNAYSSKITVGRARNNDVIIRSPKISKLHASFLPDSKLNYKLQDMSSLNGSVINGERIKAKKRIPLTSGDMISFWRFIFEFISLDEFISRLKGL